MHLNAPDSHLIPPNTPYLSEERTKVRLEGYTLCDEFLHRLWTLREVGEVRLQETHPHHEQNLRKQDKGSFPLVSTQT